MRFGAGHLLPKFLSPWIERPPELRQVAIITMERTMRPIWRQLGRRQGSHRYDATWTCRRHLSAEVQQELEPASTLSTASRDVSAEGFDPLERKNGRKVELPASR